MMVKVWVGLIILLLCVGIYIMYLESTMKPFRLMEKYEGKLVAINGIKDSDSGLLSRGSTRETNLVFEDGTIYFFDIHIKKIKLNENVTIFFYKSIIGGNELIKIKQLGKTIVEIRD